MILPTIFAPLGVTALSYLQLLLGIVKKVMWWT